MPVTRSSSRSANSRPNAVVPREEARQGSRSSKVSRRGKLPVDTKAAQNELLGPPSQAVGRADDNDVEGSKSSVENGETPVLVPAVLSFSFEDAKRHLVGVDTRFADVFDKMQCRPFQQLQRLHPFRALVESILGQQISWMAARSVNHKFKRLYSPSLPEKPTDYTPLMSSSYFPTPQQVSDSDVATLKTAGLSTRKAEYVKDLAARFADGRLSTETLIAANDEELVEMLTAVRGIGKWTVDMFAIFSLRRPDILPVGDLGVQRGLIRWFLALHSPTHPIMLSPKKVSGQASHEKKDVAVGGEAKLDGDVLPVPGQDEAGQNFKEADVEMSFTPDMSSVPPAASLAVSPRNEQERGLPSMPTPFTPSIDTVLKSSVREPAPLPEGLSTAVLKTRLDGKKKIKGALLTPREMEDLTDSWRPYRSIGVYYMWSLAEQK